MANKFLKQKRQEWNENGEKSKENRKLGQIYNDNIITVDINNLLVKVQSWDYIKPMEIIEQVKDLFSHGLSYKEGDKIELSRYTNSCFDLICTRLEEKDNKLEVNMLAC